MHNERLKTWIRDELVEREEKQLMRRVRTVTSAQDARIVVDGKEVLNFCSNNYLGLANDQRVISAMAVSLGRDGCGSGASRLVCGTLSAHTDLEEAIAQYKHSDACLVFTSGYTANVGIISALFDRHDTIFSDRLNHASITDGILLSGAKHKRYPHADMAALERLLKETQPGVAAGKRLIVTDSVFSMDGDIAPLADIVTLARRYDCAVMVDEAHAFGVCGKTGAGIAEAQGVSDQIDIQMGTLSKAVGCAGAYCCGSRALISCLVQKARSFIYTTALPPSVAAGAHAAIAIMRSEPQRRTRLWENTTYMRTRLQAAGFDTLRSETPIIPLMVKDSAVAVAFSQRLFEAGILISAIRPPTVPANTARLRLTLMATHTKEEIDYVVTACTKIGQTLCR